MADPKVFSPFYRYKNLKSKKLCLLIAVQCMPLHFSRRLHRTDIYTGLAFQTQIYINKCPVFNKTYSRAGTQVNTAATTNTLFSINSNHAKASF
jgi:hypothetical protein